MSPFDIDPQGASAPTVPFRLALFAEELGLTVEKRSDMWRAEHKATLGGTWKGVPLSIKLKQSPNHRLKGQDEPGIREVTHHELEVTVSAGFKFGRGPTMKLLREGTFRSFLSRYGYQDIQVGDRDLDFQLTIKGEPEDLVKEVVLQNVVALRRLATDRDASLPRSDGQRIWSTLTLSTEERDTSIDAVKGLADTLAGLAGTDLVHADSLLALPGAAEELTPKDRWCIRLDAANPVRFLPRWHKDAFQLVAQVDRPEGLESARFESNDREAILRHTQQAALVPLLAGLEVTVAILDDHIEVQWAGLESDEETLLRAAKALGLMATHTQMGVYR